LYETLSLFGPPCMVVWQLRRIAMKRSKPHHYPNQHSMPNVLSKLNRKKMMKSTHGVMLGALKMTDMKMTDRRNVQAWNWLTWKCRTCFRCLN